MLRTNPLQPPRPFVSVSRAIGGPLSQPESAASHGFLSAEDFDHTGILTGVDPCESRYWWLPELYGPEHGPAPAVNLADA